MSEMVHGPECPCTRCRGFQPGNVHGAESRAGEGNELATTHGAYSPRRLLEAAEEEYQALRASLVPWDPIFEQATRALAEIKARKRLALVWLDEHGLVDDVGNVRAILQELPKWERRETELLREMAATVRSRAELDLDWLARERGMISLHEVAEFRTVVLESVNAVLERLDRGELVSGEARRAFAAELQRRGEVIAARESEVVEGEARRLERGAPDA